MVSTYRVTGTYRLVEHLGCLVLWKGIRLEGVLVGFLLGLGSGYEDRDT
jgi:hypothetical protein